jgi:hypothetical protein
VQKSVDVDLSDRLLIIPQRWLEVLAPAKVYVQVEMRQLRQLSVSGKRRERAGRCAPTSSSSASAAQAM